MSSASSSKPAWVPSQRLYFALARFAPFRRAEGAPGDRRSRLALRAALRRRQLGWPPPAASTADGSGSRWAFSAPGLVPAPVGRLGAHSVLVQALGEVEALEH